METKLQEEKLNQKDRVMISHRFNCSPEYVLKISKGERSINSRKSKSINKAIEIVLASKAELKIKINQPDLDAE